MKESTRKRKQEFILSAASTVIAAKGITNFTMEEVAEEGNVTKVTLYSYFQSKENLLMAVIQNVTHFIHSRLKDSELSASAMKGSQYLSAVLENCIDSIIHYPFCGCLLSEYLPLYHQSSDHLSSALAESHYFDLVQKDLDDLIHQIQKAITKGQSDKSIVSTIKPKTMALSIFNDFVGFASTAYICDKITDENGKSLAALKTIHLGKLKAVTAR